MRHSIGVTVVELDGRLTHRPERDDDPERPDPADMLVTEADGGLVVVGWREGIVISGRRKMDLLCERGKR